MHDGAPISQWTSMDGTMLTGVLLFFLGLWVLVAQFSRESHRFAWAWSRPRNLALRNASETPRTLGVILNHVLALLGLTTSSMLFAHEIEVSQPWWLIPSWMASGMAFRWIGGRLAFGSGDLSSALVELNRHHNTWVALVMCIWTGISLFNPFLRMLDFVAIGGVFWFLIAMIYGAIRASQLVRSSHSHRVVGILYLCTLEWGWSLFWTLWSIRAALRGH